MYLMTVEDNESVDFSKLKWRHHSGPANGGRPLLFCILGRLCPRLKIIKMQRFSRYCAGDPSFFLSFVWIQNCHFLSDEMRRTNKEEKCSKSAAKDWPSSADRVVSSSHVGIIFCTKGDVLIKHLFITRSVPRSGVPSCSIMPEKTHDWYLELGLTSGKPQD